MVSLQLLHGHWHHDPNRQLTHSHRGIREDAWATNYSPATVPVPTSLPRGEELDGGATTIQPPNQRDNLLLEPVQYHDDHFYMRMYLP